MENTRSKFLGSQVEMSADGNVYGAILGSRELCRDACLNTPACGQVVVYNSACYFMNEASNEVEAGSNEGWTSYHCPIGWQLKRAVDECINETPDGSCPIFSNHNGVMGDWNVSQAQDMGAVFLQKGSFNADISKWDTSSSTDMSNSRYL